MSAITVRKLPDEVKQRLRMRAAANGRSMEAEARDILLTALTDRGTGKEWVEQLMEAARTYDPVHGVDLDIPPRTEPARFVDFSGPEFDHLDPHR